VDRMVLDKIMENLYWPLKFLSKKKKSNT